MSNVPSQREEESLIALRAEAYRELKEAERNAAKATERVAIAQERFLTLSARLGR